MSQLSDPTLTLFTLHGLAVSLRDRADIIAERAEALLTHVEGAIAHQMRGEPIDLGELISLVEAVETELGTSHRLSERLRRGARDMVDEAGLLLTLPKLMSPSGCSRPCPPSLMRPPPCAGPCPAPG